MVYNDKQEYVYVYPRLYKLLWDGIYIKERKGPSIQVLENLRWFEMIIALREAYVDSKRVNGGLCILMSVDMWKVQHLEKVEG